jgi:YVTN family beta-propeller protein
VVALRRHRLGAPAAGRRSGNALRIGVGLAVVAVLAVAAILNNRTSVVHVNHAALTRILQGPAVGVFNVIGGQAHAAVSLSAVPTRLTAGLGAAWATSYDDGTLLRIDTGDQAVAQTIRVGNGATGVAVYAGDVWVADTLDGRVTRVDGGADQVVQRIPVGNGPVAVAGGSGAVWVVSSEAGTVTRIDPSTGAVAGVTRVGLDPSSIAVGAGGVWVTLEDTRTLVRLDPRTGRPVATIAVGSAPSAVAALGHRVWVANRLDSTVSLIDPATDRVVLTHPVAGAPAALAPVGNTVWASGDSRVLSNVTAAGRFHTIPVASPATALTIDAGQLLVGVSGSVADHRGGTLTARLAGPIGQIDPGAR